MGDMANQSAGVQFSVGVIQIPLMAWIFMFGAAVLRKKFGFPVFDYWESLGVSGLLVLVQDVLRVISSK